MTSHQFRVLFLFFSIFICKLSTAQFTSAMLGVDGLTCSACSYGTEMSIRRLDFVDSIKMELNKNIAEITFKKDKEVSIDALVKKVYDAGFSVRFVQAVYHFDQPITIANNIFKIGAATFYVLKTNSSTLSGNVTFNFIKEKFVPKKELLKWKTEIATAKAQTGIITTPIYYVIIQ